MTKRKDEARIALCDDDPADLNRLQTSLEGYLKNRNLRAEVVSFSHPDALLCASEKQLFDLYLLDVVLDMVSGIQVARELRTQAPDVPIVFFSTSHDYAYEAFQVAAVTYVGKPWTAERFDAALDEAMARLRTEERISLTLGKEGQLRRFRADTIEYVVTADTVNYVVLHLADGSTVETRSSVRTFAEEHRDILELVPIGRSLLINPRQVANLERGLVHFRSGRVLAVPKSVFNRLAASVLRLDIS